MNGVDLVAFRNRALGVGAVGLVATVASPSRVLSEPMSSVRIVTGRPAMTFTTEA